MARYPAAKVKRLTASFRGITLSDSCLLLFSDIHALASSGSIQAWSSPCPSSITFRFSTLLIFFGKGRICLLRLLFCEEVKDQQGKPVAAWVEESVTLTRGYGDYHRLP